VILESKFIAKQAVAKGIWNMPEIILMLWFGSAPHTFAGSLVMSK